MVLSYAIEVWSNFLKSLELSVRVILVLEQSKPEVEADDYVACTFESCCFVVTTDCRARRLQNGQHRNS
jgi:hypothetical protein